MILLNPSINIWGRKICFNLVSVLHFSGEYSVNNSLSRCKVLLRYYDKTKENTTKDVFHLNGCVFVFQNRGYGATTHKM